MMALFGSAFMTAVVIVSTSRSASTLPRGTLGSGPICEIDADEMFVQAARPGMTATTATRHRERNKRIDDPSEGWRKKT